MTELKIYDLATKLLEKTRRGEVTWEGTPLDESFLTSLAAFSVTVDLVKSYGDTYGSVRLSISDSEGRTIEASEADDIAKKLVNRGYTLAEVKGTLRDLYTEARRSVTGINAALDKMLSELE